MLIGLSTYTYTWAFGVPGSLPAQPMRIYDLINKASALGLDCVQVADNFPLGDQQAVEIQHIRDHARQNGIGIEVGTRGLTEENLDRYIDLAVFFSSPILRMVIDRQDYRPDTETVVSVIRNMLQKLAREKVILAIENHDRLHSSAFRQIIEEVGSEFAGICLDCVNSMGIGEGIDAVLSNLAPYTVNLHVKDFVVKRVSHMMGFVIEGTPAGKGFLDLPAVMKRLQPFAKCKSAILELWTPPSPTLAETLEKENAWARESAIYLKKLIPYL